MNDEEMNESGKYLRLLYSHLNKRIKARSALLRLSLPGLLSQRPGVKAQRGRGSGPTGASAWSGHLNRRWERKRAGARCWVSCLSRLVLSSFHQC